jgi:hypothetical protein
LDLIGPHHQFTFSVKMAGSANPRLAKIKTEQFVKKAGKKSGDDKKKDDAPMVPPWVLGLLLFVVVGSVVMQIINNARNAGTMGQNAVYEG